MAKRNKRKEALMALRMTENTSAKALHDAGWEIWPPLNTIEATAEQFAAAIELTEDMQQVGLLGDIKLTAEGAAHPIDEQTHQRLLDESLSDYGGIWMALAER